MKRNSLGTWAAAIACFGMSAPPAARATSPTESAAAFDVALRPGGVLVGQVVDRQGVAKAGTTVSIRYAGQEVARTTTDTNGVFAAKGLRGGQYELLTQESSGICRLWAPDTAPPAAKQTALVVAGDDVVRGQGPMNAWVEWIKAHPYITAGTVAAAIAIPLALADDDFDNGS